MTRSLILQDFASAAPDISPNFDSPNPSLAPEQLDEADALESYDSGYKSGWADCTAAAIEERTAIGADLAKNLSNAELTYDSARRDIIAALGPFFEDVASTLLPKMASAALAPTVLAELGALAEGHTAQSIEILAAPASCASLERLADGEPFTNLIVRPEPAFAEGQVSIRIGAEQRDLDMSNAAARIADAIEAFSQSLREAETQIPQQGVA